MRPLGIYIDFPFCIARCAFCAFNVEGYRKRWADRYMAALRQEIEYYGKSLEGQDRIFTSIYLGGGTPSHHPVAVLDDLLSLCHSLFNITADAEITIETHPATVNLNKLSELREIGINRLSFGVQSFSDADLKTLGRHHTVKDVDTAFRSARSAGFTNIGIDLIYGLPEQTIHGWETTLHHATALSPEHISTYALSIEEGTLFARKEKEDLLSLPSEGDTIHFYKIARNKLAAAGYEQYEISNFAKSGYDCRHNLLYWNQHEILAFGLAAHTYFKHERRVNTDNIPLYIEKMASGSLPLIEVQPVGQREILIDRIIFGLRKTKGIPLHLLKNDPLLLEITEQLSRKKLLEINENRLQLTSQGMLFSDEVAMAYL